MVFVDRGRIVARSGLVALVWTLLFGVVLGGCAPKVTSEVTGRKIPVILSWDEEIRLGEATAESLVEQAGGLFEDEAAQTYVDRVGKRLVPRLEPELPELPWSFELLDSGVINAFSLPGGKVYISRGLASLLRSEAELAGVLGHEMAHVTLRHSNQRLAKLYERNSPVLVPAAILSILVPKEAIQPVVGTVMPVIEIGNAPFTLRFGRGQELEADSVGVRYMAAAGYNPRGQEIVLETLRDAGGARPPTFFSTHPAPGDRAVAIDRLLDEDFAEWAGEDGSPDGGWYRERYGVFREGIVSERVGVVSGRWCANCASGR